MDVKRLGYFVRIAGLGSLSAAAERLHVSQPSLSRQIRLLEEELGTSLFLRHRRGLTLTPEGEELHARIAAPLQQIEGALRDFRQARRKTLTQLVLGMPPTVGNVLAGALARRMAEPSSPFALRIVEAFAGHLASSIGRGEIDAAFLDGPASDWPAMKWGPHLEGLQVDELLREDMALVGSPGSLDPARPVDLEGLTSLPLVLPSRDSQPRFLRALEDEVLARFGKGLNRSASADSFQLTRQFVESGLGFALLPYSSVARDIEVGRLAWTPVAGYRVSRLLVLAVRTDCLSAGELAAFRSTVRKEISDLVHAGDWQAELLF